MGDIIRIPCPNCGERTDIHSAFGGRGIIPLHVASPEVIEELDGTEHECALCASTFAIRAHHFALTELLTEGSVDGEH